MAKAWPIFDMFVAVFCFISFLVLGKEMAIKNFIDAVILVYLSNQELLSCTCLIFLGIHGRSQLKSNFTFYGQLFY